MARKSKEELEKIKKTYNVQELYSWSKFNTYCTDPYGFYLKYIMHEKETRNSIYGVSGGVCHQIIEDFYSKELTYEQMLEEYEEKLFEMNMAELKYNRSDEVANKKIADKYENCIRLFYQQHIPIEGKVIIEQFVTIKVGKHVFQGYVDFIHKDEDGNYNILDWKTSTIYSGKKIDKEKNQLVLYAESLVQRGIPIEKIKIAWNFLKYCKVTYTQSGKDKVTKLHKTSIGKYSRHQWVDSIKNNLKMWLTKSEQYDELEVEDMIALACENNNLDNIPQEIQDKYKLEDCYVYIPLDQEVINELNNKIINTIKEIEDKRIEYEETKDDRVWWTNITAADEFFFYNLSGYSVNQHKPFKEYLEDSNKFVIDVNKDNDEMDWLKDL